MESICEKGHSAPWKNPEEDNKTSRPTWPWENVMNIDWKPWDSTQTTLQRRRLRGDLIEAYKILTGKEIIDFSSLFQKAKTTYLTGHSLKLYKKRSWLDVRKHFFSQRIVDYWNRLPDDSYCSYHFLFQKNTRYSDGQIRTLKAYSLTSPLTV